jgi:hypothetical protein
MASEGGVASSMAVARRIWFNKSMGLAASRIEPLPFGVAVDLAFLAVLKGSFNLGLCTHRMAVTTRKTAQPERQPQDCETSAESGDADAKGL